MRNEFSTFDIIKALGIPRERLRAWMKDGYIFPYMSAPSQGKRAIFNRADVYTVALLNELIEYGFKRNVAAEFVSFYGEKISSGVFDYLIFRTKTSFSEDLFLDVWPVPASNEELLISLKTGTLVAHNYKGIELTTELIDSMVGNIADWSKLFILNLKEFCKKTDKQLSTIE